MSEEIKWSVDVQVTGGPKLSSSAVLEVEAYDKIDVVVPAQVTPAEGEEGDSVPGTATLQVQPGDASQVQFLLITSSVYSEVLTYKVGTAIIKLDALQLFMGSGSVGLLGQPTQFEFSNNTDKSASIEILVGRKATATK